MKTFINNLFTRLGGASCAAWILPALIAGLGLMSAGWATAQTFTILHTFPGPRTPYSSNHKTNSDGAFPSAELILSGNTLYGTASGGGSSGNGTVFAVNTDGTGFTTLHSFSAVPPNPYVNSDGASPKAGLILSGNTLYGTSLVGGGSGFGVVFKVNTDGTGFTTLLSAGGYPYGGLILSGNTLYGSTLNGGSSDAGTVFAVNTDGSGFTTLHSFTAPSSGINSDGASPMAGLILSGNTLYGTAYSGGSSGRGTVFAVNTDGSGFTTLHSFTEATFPTPFNRDVTFPHAGLILSGNTLYGTGSGSSGSGKGTVFALNTDGSGFATLYGFTATSGSNPSINSDGANPFAGLILSGHTLYGTAASGGSGGRGTVFAVNTDGTGFTTLYSFSYAPGPDLINSEGGGPTGGLILSGNALYGTALIGGSSGNGSVFSLLLPSVSAPQLTLSSDSSGGYFIRAQGDPNFTCRLQRAPDLSGPWDTLETQTAPASGFIEFHETNPPTGRAFYRTVQP